MTIEQIMQNVAAANAAETTAPKKKAAPKATPKPVAFTTPPPVIALPARVPTEDERLKLTVARIVKAFGLEKQGITPEAMLAGLKQYEGAAR